MNLEMTVELKGKLFTLKGAPLRDAGHQTVQTLVEMGEQRLDQVLRPRPAGVFLSVSEAQKGKASTGHYRRNVNGKVNGLNGRISDGGVLYGPWLEGVGSRNETTRFKGYGSFRRTAQELQKMVPQVLGRHLDRAIKELNS